MHPANSSDVVAEAIQQADELAHQQTDGKWLEGITTLAGPAIREWDLADCHLWSTWPDREQHFPGTTNQDVGIDVVGIRRSDGGYVAIQCKSRKLDERGIGAPISKEETDKFAAASAGDFWAERWIVTNGANPLTDQARQSHSMSGTIKLVNIVSDLRQQRGTYGGDECLHCSDPDNADLIQTKSCMQDEAVQESVRILREHAISDSGGLPVGQARGRIILPCGTGKTRISLRIVEQLTLQGELSVVLCPSIALVAQIRREYLQHATSDLRVLAVCSDQTAGFDPKKEDSRFNSDDPTLDKSNVSASVVKGMVTTDSAEIADWIDQGRGGEQISVIFGTYQSGSRVAEALKATGVKVSVLIADEAHRTAGLRRQAKTDEQRLRDFTLCHDNDAFPATYRVYQTATPRIYDTKRVRGDTPSDWVVRTMDDEQTFGVELYRKSYVEAVENEWLSDYRIIALGINDPEAYQLVNQLAQDTKSKGRRKLTSADYLRGLAFALAMGGATHGRRTGSVPIQSCIAFMNTVDKSKNMAVDLQTKAVRDWLQNWLHDNRNGQRAADYRLEHLDATSSVATRDNAKDNLALGTADQPNGIINVGIFGEGTDSPSLSAVAFLEARKSPIDVIQAVGRAMRTSPGKQLGYIICPILISPNVDPETWLSTSGPEEGWQELGQILLALRAHDSRIEDNLSDLMELHVPTTPATVQTIVAVGDDDKKRVEYRQHTGAPGTAEAAVERVIEGRSTLKREFEPLSDPPESPAPAQAQDIYGETQATGLVATTSSDMFAEPPTNNYEPTQIIAGKRHDDGSIEIRRDCVSRAKPKSDGARGQVDLEKSKRKAREMINRGTGIRVQTPVKPRRRRKTIDELAEQSALQMLDLTGLSEHGNAIRMNLLVKSGLTDNRVLRDLNILEASVKEAAFHMRADELEPTLDRLYGLHNLKQGDAKKQADGCTIAALLMMNAAMLHQRIAQGGWLSGVSHLTVVKNEVNVVRRVRREWERIMRHDFRPVLEPAVAVIEAVEDQGKLAGLERALRHIAAEAERIAETYADMGADHAGPLFNRVMGNQASDGAFFTRPTAASLAARLTLDACEDGDWTDLDVWREHKTVDLACGSGTLLAAMLTEMKRRAREGGVSEPELAELQKLAVEETIKGLDINPVSLQLAASQLTAGNHDIRYRQMGLHLMPYGPSPDDPSRVQAGTLELLSQNAIVPRESELDLADDGISSKLVWDQPIDAELEDAVDAVRNARIVIMNPPFTNRSNMGQKFPSQTQQSLRSRTDGLEAMLVRGDAELSGFVDKNAIEPLFVGLAERCLDASEATLAMIVPTVALTAPSAIRKRTVLAERFQIHTIVTSHRPGQINMSQNTSINESVLIATRHPDPKTSTRIVSLDRMPVDEGEIASLHERLLGCRRSH
ncbi:MAG: DEAD/DEAH box helicase family protein [Chloroflexi bacterium]|nr:DEAD/DEAH box helicase family protein [Chloroflexota bacterium]